MQALVLTLHIIACIILILVVLLQSGKEGMGVIFGGGSSTVFGSSGAGSLLTKVTTVLAVVFLVTSLAYNILTSSKPSTARSILMNAPEEAVQAPATPEPEALGVEIEESAPAAQTGDAGGVAIEESAPAEPEKPAQQ